MPTKGGLTTYSDLLRENARFDRARLKYEAALKRWTLIAEKRLRDMPAIAAARWKRKSMPPSPALDIESEPFTKKEKVEP